MKSRPNYLTGSLRPTTDPQSARLHYGFYRQALGNEDLLNKGCSQTIMEEINKIRAGLPPLQDLGREVLVHQVWGMDNMHNDSTGPVPPATRRDNPVIDWNRKLAGK